MPQSHRLHCQDPWFTLIQSGKKSVEGRKNHPKYRNFRIGDSVIFHLGDEEFETRIVALRLYGSIEDYLMGETISRVLPGVHSISEGVDVYLQWNTREEVKRLGFIAIEISVQ
jgi:ASC-1-like (ASCH) protein